MPIEVSHWRRRDNADREILGKSALEVCRALRATDGFTDGRFYWVNPDEIVVQATAESGEVLGREYPSDLARAFYAFADNAMQTSREWWIEPSAGEANYRAAGR